MRTIFHEQLASLTRQIGDACGLAGDAMERATQALLQADVSVAERVITDHEQITSMSTRAEQNAVVLLALQQPVAGELRAIVSSIQIAADIDRMGALAVHVAEIVRRRHPLYALPTEVAGCFSEMGCVAVELSRGAQDVVLTGDPAKAARLHDQDDEMNSLHRHLFTVSMDHRWKHGISTAVDVALLGRFYERFADHAVEIGRRVVYQATGVLPATDEISTN